ncbi:MAG: electron transfer flavoprotein subunit beta/FixA family protein [Caldisericia bacterium]|nr:electron transfer flavoprotein subunit beta/FixA family protein [Caldisericia bacterium]
MKILVLIKQIPDLESKVRVSIDKKNFSMKRQGVPSVMNPADKNALEEALSLKDKNPDITVHLITMGPKQAIAVLKEGISMGADTGLLLTDIAFAGSDTLATSLILSKTVLRFDDIKLILCGKQALDGDTGQVGPGVACRLNIPQVLGATNIDLKDKSCVVKREFRNHVEQLTTVLPSLIAFNAHCNIPRLPSLRGIYKTQEWEPTIITNNELKISLEKLGIEGSPTRVVKTFEPKLTKTTETIKFTEGSIPMDHIMKTIDEVNG